MKAVFTFLCLALSLITYAQLDYTLEPIPARVDSSAEAEDFFAHSMIKNLSDQTIIITWQRINNDIPNGWESYICSDISCAPPEVSTGNFSLTAYDSTNIDCHFNPDGIPGEGIVDLRFSLYEDSTQVIQATYFANAAPVSIHQALDSKITIYPNPATDQIFIQGNHHQSVEVYTMLGARIAKYSNQSIVDIHKLVAGGYVLKLYDDQNKLISIKPFYKTNTK